MMDLISFRSKTLAFYDFNVRKLCKYFRMGLIIISQPKILRVFKWSYNKTLKRKSQHEPLGFASKISKLTLFVVLSTGIFYLDHGNRALQNESNKGKTWQNEKTISCRLIHYFPGASQSTHPLSQYEPLNLTDNCIRESEVQGQVKHSQYVLYCTTQLITNYNQHS